MDAKVELYIDAEAVQLIDVFVDGTLLVQNIDYQVTGNTIIRYLSGYLNTLSTGYHAAQVTFSNGFIEQGILVIKEFSPSTPPTGDGGGGISLPRDHCPRGDFSPSYYDRTCDVSPRDTEHGVSEHGVSQHGTSGQ